jgi:hypothetical protein
MTARRSCDSPGQRRAIAESGGVAVPGGWRSPRATHPQPGGTP